MASEGGRIRRIRCANRIKSRIIRKKRNHTYQSDEFGLYWSITESIRWLIGLRDEVDFWCNTWLARDRGVAVCVESIGVATVRCERPCGGAGIRQAHKISLAAVRQSIGSFSAVCLRGGQKESRQSTIADHKNNWSIELIFGLEKRGARLSVDCRD